MFAPSRGLCVCSLRGIISVRKQFIFFSLGEVGNKKIPRCPSCFPLPRRLSRKFARLSWESAGQSRLSASTAVGCAGKGAACCCGVVVALGLTGAAICGTLPARRPSTGRGALGAQPLGAAHGRSGCRGSVQPSRCSSWHGAQLSSASAPERSERGAWGETGHQLAGRTW